MAQPQPGYGANPGVPPQGFDPQAMQQQYEAWQQYYAQVGQQPPADPSAAYSTYYDPQTGVPPAGVNPNAPAYAGAVPGQWNGSGPNSFNPPPPPGDGNKYGGNTGDRNGRSRGPGAGSGPGGHGFSRGNDRDGSFRNGGSGPVESKNSIFVSGLPQSANEQFINDVFSPQGEIEVSEYNGKPRIKIYQDHGVSKGECTITFRSEETARKVVETLNGQCFPGSDNRMEISYAKFNSDSRGSYGGGGGPHGGFGGGQNRPIPLRDSGGGFRGGGDRGGFGGGRGRGPPGGGFGGRDRGPPRGGNGRDRGPPRNDRSGGRGGFGGRGGGGGGGRDRDQGRDNGKGRGGNTEVRPNDWICVCGNNNFAFRRECNSCHVPRPADGGIPAPPGGGRGGRGGGFGGRGGGGPRGGGGFRGGGGGGGMRGPPRDGGPMRGPPRDGGFMRGPPRDGMRGGRPPRDGGDRGDRNRPY